MAGDLHQLHDREMEDGERQPQSAEVVVIGEGIPIHLRPAAHGEEEEEGAETSPEEIVTLTVTEIPIDVHPQGVIHHLTEVAGVGEVGNDRRQVHGQGARRDAEDHAMTDYLFLVHSMYILATVCSV